MLRAQLWHPAEKGNLVSAPIANVRRLLGSDVGKSRLLPAAAGVNDDLKTVEQVKPDATNRIIKVKATRNAALVNQPPKRFLKIDKTIILINGDVLEHLPPETMCRTGLYDVMARTDTLICTSPTVVDNM